MSEGTPSTRRNSFLLFAFVIISLSLLPSFSSSSSCPYIVYKPTTRGGIRHPGGFMDNDMIAKLRCLQGTPSAQKAVAALLTSAPLNYKPQALERCVTGWADASTTNETKKVWANSHDSLIEDAAQAYSQAIAFHVTCDPRHAQITLQILDQWATKNVEWSGKNGPLEAGWFLASVARAAELLKYTYRDWNVEIENKFKNWVNERLVQQLQNFLAPSDNHYASWFNNWHTTIGEALLQWSIFTDSLPGVNQATYRVKRVLAGKKDQKTGKSDAFIDPSGQEVETCRDIFHTQFGVSSLTNSMETLYHQGTDLYRLENDAVVKTLEFHAHIILKGTFPTNQTYYDREGKKCILNGIKYIPGWYIPFNHFTRRVKVNMPLTKQLIQKNDPERYIFHWGLGAITHPLNPVADCSPSPAPSPVVTKFPAKSPTPSSHPTLNPNGSQCSGPDVPPPGAPWNCTQQKTWGKCGESWMKGYCCSTCGDGPEAFGKRNKGLDVVPPGYTKTCAAVANEGKCMEPFVHPIYCCITCQHCIFN